MIQLVSTLFIRNNLRYIDNWSVQNLLDRGWVKYKNRTNGQNQVLLLCPLCDFCLLPSGTQLWNANGQMCVKDKDIFDWETQAGILHYGVWCSY